MRQHLRKLAALATLLLVPAAMLYASEGEKPVRRHYVTAPPAPMSQPPEQAAAKSAGCYSCHTRTDEPSMHASSAVVLGCTDCHGGDATVQGDPSRGFTDPAYVAARDRAHILPRY
ncbi:MAG: repeat protein precursor, partial [Sphingomonas bacterium]|nr:repeat protein precursor [Sphingomonas bacterium]